MASPQPPRTIVTLSDNLLSIKGRTIEIDFGMYTKPEIYYVNNKIYITFTDTQTQKLYIYDSNSNLLPNFPIFGIGAAVIDDINLNGIPEIAVKTDAQTITAYSM